MAREDLEEAANNTKYKEGVNRNARLIVRNISFKATEDSLKEHFSQFGTVEEVKLLKKPDGKLVGCGFVHYTHVPMASEALAATNKKDFLGRQLSVAWSVPKDKYAEVLQNEDVKKRLNSNSSDKFKLPVKNESSEKTIAVMEKKIARDDLQEAANNTKYKEGVNRNARLIVRNISFKATEDSLKEHFSQFGTVEEVKLLKKPDGKLVGCGFVHFTHVPMASEALAATNKKDFLGRQLSVAWSVPKDKYAEELQNGDVKKGLNRNYSDEFKVPVKNESSEKTKAEKEKKLRVNRKARLIIRNISFKATEQTLKEHFENYGEVIDVKLLKKPDGKLVGCAFVHFKNVPMAKKALLSTNMKPFLGRPISVDWAVAKDQYMKHTINQQLEMQEKVKKEDSDSDDDDGPQMNMSNDELKPEIKSESDDDESVKSEIDSDRSDLENENESEGSDEEEDDDGEESHDEDDEDEPDHNDDQSVTSAQPERQRIRLNDAEDGCTVFLTNIPFSIDSDQLRQFVEQTGPVKYALVCVDKLTEHSKGSGFVKFANAEDAEKFLALPPSQLKLEGQVMQAKPALKRENLQKSDNKQPKDNRNLYLVKEGVVVAGTKAAVGVSASDMAKRLTLERSKTQMLKNLNRFVSRYRLVVSNLPAHYDDAKLRRLCVDAGSRSAVVTEARVMRDLRSPLGRDGRHPSKGYGFVMFTRHEDALACLRKLNNNPDVFDRNNRPIVSFSIEDRTALNARKKRLEKSIANNPLAKYNDGDAEQEENERQTNKRNRKRKQLKPPDESYVKKGRFDQNNAKRARFDNDNERKAGFEHNNNKKRRFENKHRNRNQMEEVGRFVRRPGGDEADEYIGLTAKQGAQHKMRSSHKLKTQADVHKQNVKLEKKQSKRALQLKIAAKERIKQPKQKINKNRTGKRRRFKRNKSVL